MAASSKISDNEILSKICKKLEEQQEFLGTIVEKLSNIEMRQSHTGGEINDAMRALDAFAKGDNASCPSNAMDKIIECIKDGKRASYASNFLEKDMRRCEATLTLLHEYCVHQNEWLLTQGQQQTGELVYKMPTMIEMFHKKGVDMQGPEDSLLKLLELIIPVSRCFKPTRCLGALSGCSRRAVPLRSKARLRALGGGPFEGFPR